MERQSNRKIVDTFMELVRVPSPTFHEEMMAKEVHSRLSAMGLSPEIDKEGNVLVFLAGDKDKEPLMLNAHLDTVQKLEDQIEPYVDEDGWIRAKSDTILGADNKTAVAAILEVVERLAKEKVSHNPLEVVFTVSEESGNHGAHGLDYKRLKAKRGFLSDASGREFGDMIISSPAYARFDMKLIGKKAHASRPELGKNVLPVFARALLKTELGQVDELTQVNIGIVSVGEVGQGVNTVPGEIIVSGEVRKRDEENLEEYCQAIIRVFENEAKEAGMELEAQITKENGAFAFKKDESFITKTVEALRGFGVENPKLIESWGCYEANIFAENGVVMLNIADGSMDAHEDTERVKVSDLERLEDLIYRLVTT